MSRDYLPLSPELVDAISKLALPNPLGFGQHVAPVVANSFYQNGEWNQAKLEPIKPITLMPNAKVFHYSQQIFESPW